MNPRKDDNGAPPLGGALVPLVRAGGIVPLTSETAQRFRARQFLTWLQFVRRRSENTIAAYSFDLETFAAFCDRAGLITPGQVTLQMIEAYLAWLQYERGLSAATANRHRAALKALFTYLKREGHVASNPVTDTFPLKQPKRLPKYLTITEQEHVLAALAEDDSPAGWRDLALVAVGLFCGLRCAELAHLRLVDVNLVDGILRVEQGKGAKDRELPIIGRLRAILERYLAVRAQLLGQPVGEMYRRTPTSIWRLRYTGPDGDQRVNTHTYSRDKARRMLDEAAPRPGPSPWFFVHAAPRRSYQLKRAAQALNTRSLFAIVLRRVAPLVGRKVSPHTLRRSFASRLRERGADLQLIQEALGHSSITTTAIYAFISTSKRREDLERLLS